MSALTNGLPFWHSTPGLVSPLYHQAEFIANNNRRFADELSRVVFVVRLEEDKDRRHFSRVIETAAANVPSLAQAAALLIKSAQASVSFEAHHRPGAPESYWLATRSWQIVSIRVDILPPEPVNPEDERRSKFYTNGDEILQSFNNRRPD